MLAPILALILRKPAHIIGCGAALAWGSAPVSIEQFLEESAVDIAVAGNYTLGKWLDPQGKQRIFACRTSRVSPFRMMVDVPVVGRIGGRVKAYFRDFGHLEGVITHTTARGFLFELEMSETRREKFANKLAWLETKLRDPDFPDSRKDARIVPANPHSVLIMPDGTTHRCFVIDMSVSGVAVSAEVQPERGMPLAVGACVGRVVRLFDDGFAIKFVEPQKRDDLDRVITRYATAS
jgi:hypothetical protein